MGERLPCKQEANGSNPFISTRRAYKLKGLGADGKEPRLRPKSEEARKNGLIAQQVRAHA